VTAPVGGYRWTGIWRSVSAASVYNRNSFCDVELFYNSFYNGSVAQP
jgi:hypothetical protein